MLNPRDYGRFHLRGGAKSMLLSHAGIEDWPPPPTITHLAGVELPEPMVRCAMSPLTDVQARNPNFVRGVDYRFESDPKVAGRNAEKTTAQVTV